MSGAQNYAEPPQPALVARFFAIWWLAGAAVWLLLDDTVKFDELLAGALASTLGATGATLVYRQRLVELAGRWAWLRHAGRPLRQVPGDLWLLGAALLRAIGGGSRDPGAMAAVPFRAGGARAERNARQALASAAGTFAPNTIVLDFDEQAERMLVHELAPQAHKRRSADPLELG